MFTTICLCFLCGKVKQDLLDLDVINHNICTFLPVFQTVFLCCCPDCPNYFALLNGIGSLIMLGNHKEIPTQYICGPLFNLWLVFLSVQDFFIAAQIAQVASVCYSNVHSSIVFRYCAFRIYKDEERDTAAFLSILFTIFLLYAQCRVGHNNNIQVKIWWKDNMVHWIQMSTFPGS